ncbi:signal recognition particle receptor subunit beta-like [Planoprotostelium fungivorum]|uniref:Signal recognition particle receptor subunit beta n=1 Tax=Planoprotostelium fungivorum TaxID=1890364 RepID=A0A2P6NAA2_9EUKA|nr:signal recognition particle receptor subunit beta-like [Planoprotostelium fungivorum]
MDATTTTESDSSLLIIIALTLTLIAVVGFIAKRFFLSSPETQRREDTVVFTGLSDTGKTSLFLQLRDGNQSTETHTSIVENVFDHKINQKMVKIVDSPGANRVRNNWMKYVNRAKAFVFVVDAANYDSRNSAEFLYDVLSHPSIFRAKVPLCIVCNKSDIVTAHPSSSIKTQMEREITQLSKTRRAFPQQTEGNEVVNLCPQGQPFVFGKNEQPVTFVEASGKEGNIQEIDSWLSKLFQ